MPRSAVRDSENVNPVGGVLDHEEDVEPGQGDGIEVAAVAERPAQRTPRIGLGRRFQVLGDG
jgi:hypothetical protein